MELDTAHIDSAHATYADALIPMSAANSALQKPISELSELHEVAFQHLERVTSSSSEKRVYGQPRGFRDPKRNRELHERAVRVVSDILDIFHGFSQGLESHASSEREAQEKVVNFTQTVIASDAENANQISG